MIVQFVLNIDVGHLAARALIDQGSSGGLYGLISFASGFRARLTSRKRSWCDIRSIFMPVACRLASTPDIRLLNSATNSLCSRRLRSIHFVADMLKLLPRIFFFHSKSGDW